MYKIYKLLLKNNEDVTATTVRLNFAFLTQKWITNKLSQQFFANNSLFELNDLSFCHILICTY